MSLSDMTCPFCGSSGILPVIYGYAPFDILVRADRGEVILGGGLVSSRLSPTGSVLPAAGSYIRRRVMGNEKIW